MINPTPSNYPKLALPDGEETIAFRAVDKILRNDDALKRVVLYYESYNGDAFDAMEPDDYSCPFLRIAPKPMPGHWESESQQHLPFSVLIQCAIQGTDASQIMNLWGHVRRALWPRDPVLFAANSAIMNDAGIVKGTLALGAFGALFPKVKDPPVVLMAQGALNLFLLVNTP